MKIRFEHWAEEGDPEGTPKYVDVEFPERELRLLKKAVTAMRSAKIAYAEGSTVLDQGRVTFLVENGDGALVETEWEGRRVRINKIGPHGDYYSYFNLTHDWDNYDRGTAHKVVFTGPDFEKIETARVIFADSRDGEVIRKHLRNTIAFAKEVGAWDRLRDRLRWLAQYAPHRNDVSCVVGKDFAPYSFNFLLRTWDGAKWTSMFSGGLIYHGPGAPGDGGAPSFVVDLAQDRPEHDWGIHT